MNLNDRKFKAIENNKGLSSSETIFHYFQKGKTITGKYQGGKIIEGFIVGKQVNESMIELLFQCLTTEDDLLTGESTGVVTENKEGLIELKFDWNWLNGDKSGGESHYIEMETQSKITFSY